MLLAKTECFFMHKIMQYLENEENFSRKTMGLVWTRRNSLDNQGWDNPKYEYL